MLKGYDEVFKEVITKPIVLIGMVGSGKSTAGKKLARRLNLQFYDTDKIIEERQGLSIVDIYEFRGESFFKAQEEKILEEVLGYGIVVISTGGETFINEKLRNMIKEKAISILLSADLETLYTRIARRNTRPQFNNGDKRKILEKMISEMESLYSEADIVIQNDQHDTHYIVDAIVAKLKKSLGID